MRRKRIKGASIAAIGSHSPKFQTENHKPESSKSKNNEKRSTLHSATGYATISLGGTKAARRLGGLRFLRRLIAMPFMAFSFCAIDRTHGVSLPKTLTGTPYGNLKGLSLPKERSANLYGVAHPLGGGVSFTTDNLALGDSHE